jgi:hypothetical protein
MIRLVIMFLFLKAIKVAHAYSQQQVPVASVSQAVTVRAICAINCPINHVDGFP